MTLESAIKHAEQVVVREDNNAQVYDKVKNDNLYHPDKITCEQAAKRCRECAAEHRQLAEWLKILKSAKFEYNEAWLTITHPTPDVTYADKQRAQVILDKFRNSLGAISALQTQDVNDKNTEDTISRRNVIDETKRYFHDEYYQRTSIQDCINCFIEDILTKLPSVQTEPATEIQEILNYLDTTLHPIVSPDNWNVYAELHDMVSKLPSAQPEIVRCKDCKHFQKWRSEESAKKFGQIYECGNGILRNPVSDDFCSRAERREE